MTKSDKTSLIALGSGLITLAVIPTPDDITIVSPVAQMLLGVTLVGFGVFG